MSIQELMNAMAERLAGASVKQVFGDPVVSGSRTVIPAARVRYAFGFGAGPRKGGVEKAGGGGRVSAKPCGVLEITPEGTRFVPAGGMWRIAAAAAAGFLAGAAAMALLRAAPGSIRPDSPRP
jgi:uncharacterized spore protein YtfJ